MATGRYASERHSGADPPSHRAGPRRAQPRILVRKVQRVRRPNRRRRGPRPCDDRIRAAGGDALSARLSSSLFGAAETDGIDGLAKLAAALERSRDLARGSPAVIRDRREAARAAERPSPVTLRPKVEGKLILTLVLWYLPALMLLVVIPLF